MASSSSVARVQAPAREMRWRHRFTLVTLGAIVALIAWGGFVTSIDAGLAVPDWPSSFNSYDPFNPWPQWWTITPVLAEHGHRLLGALVGMLTLVLAAWTWAADPRRWMRLLSVSALVLVIVQGVLGGLRVVWVSLDLAVVHACVAQIFFAMIAGMALFTSRAWLAGESVLQPSAEASRLRRAAVVTALALYAQILLGALLRHPGTGIHLGLAMSHMTWAFVVTGLIVVTTMLAFRVGDRAPLIRRAAHAVAGIVGLQVALGFTAYFVLLDERGMIRPSNLQVVVNTSHLVVGALLMSSTVVLTLLVLRRPSVHESTVHTPAAADNTAVPVVS